MKTGQVFFYGLCIIIIFIGIYVYNHVLCRNYDIVTEEQVIEGYWDKGAFRQPFWIPERTITVTKKQCKWLK